MPTYRIYVLSEDGHIHHPPEVIDCPGDEMALDSAKRLLDGHVIEIWDHGRLVARLDPKEH
jgi:hypothetical protein